MTKMHTSSRQQQSDGSPSLTFTIAEQSRLPFELFHMSDCTILLVQGHLNDLNLNWWYECLQGLLYFRRKKIVIEIWEPIHHAEGYKLFVDFTAAVRKQKGKIAIVCDHSRYVEQLKSDLQKDVYPAFQEIPWMSSKKEIVKGEKNIARTTASKTLSHSQQADSGRFGRYLSLFKRK